MFTIQNNRPQRQRLALSIRPSQTRAHVGKGGVKEKLLPARWNTHKQRKRKGLTQNLPETPSNAFSLRRRSTARQSQRRAPERASSLVCRRRDACGGLRDHLGHDCRCDNRDDRGGRQLSVLGVNVGRECVQRLTRPISPVRRCFDGARGGSL